MGPEGEAQGQQGKEQVPEQVEVLGAAGEQGAGDGEGHGASGEQADRQQAASVRGLVRGHGEFLRFHGSVELFVQQAVFRVQTPAEITWPG